MHARIASTAALAVAIALSPTFASDAAEPSTPPRAAATAQKASSVQEARLSNGMRVLLVEDHSAPVATFSVFFKVGSRNEYTGNTGSAHLLEHMQFKGTKRFKKGDIMAALDRIGAQWNATTFYDYTNYYETVPIDRLEFALELEADRMQNSLILDEERDLERIVVRNELERSENSPIRSLSDEVWAAAYKAHPYHHPVIGWRSDVEGVPTSRLRDFYKTFYQPDNAIAVLVGDFEPKKALALVEKHFSKVPGGHSFPELYTTEPEQKGERRVVVNKAGDMKVVALAFKAPAASDPDTIPLKLLHLVLTGELDLGPFGDPLDPGIGNRLYQALVEKELATSAGVDYTPLKDPGIFMVLALPRPEVAHDKVEKAVRAQLDRLKNELVSPQELERAKARAAAAYGLMQDGTSGRAMLLGYFAAIADWKLADEFPARVQAVTAEDLQRVARKYLVDERLTTGWFVPKTTPVAESTPPQQRHTVREALRATRLPSFEPAAEAAPRPAPAAQPGSIAAQIRRTVLPNGLTVLVKENHSSPTFTISGSIKAGGVFDPEGKPDTASVTADALIRGSRQKTKLQIAQALEEVGASLDYGAGAEEVGVSARGLSKDFDRVLGLLAETLTEPAFPPQEVEKLKREAIAQLQQHEDSPATRGRRAFMQGLYPKGHPYYIYPLKEELAALKALTPQALRAFHQKHYGADRVVLAIVGDVDADRVVEAIQKRLGGMKKTGVSAIEIARVPPRTEPGEQVVFVPEKSNVDVFFGHQGVLTRTDPDYYPAMVANFIFGGSASARLFQEVRDRRGLTYGIYASLGATHGAGPWNVWMTLNPGNVEKALPVVKQMAKELVEKGVTAEELAAAKQNLTGKYKVGLATNSGVASVIASFESYGFPPEFVDEHPRRIEAVTREQVLAALQKYFHPDDALVVIAGTYPAARAEGPQKDSTPAASGGSGK